MARPGLSYEDVKKTAAVLLEQGMSPSIQRVRAVLGTGSNSTIAEHLKRWQQELETTPRAALPPAVPEAVMAAVEAFWQVAIEHAEQLYEIQRSQVAQAAAAAEQKRTEAVQAIEQAQQQAADWRQQLVQAQTHSKQLEESLLIEKERRKQAEAAIEAAEQRALDATRLAEQTRTEAQSRLVGLKEAFCQTLAEAKVQLTEAEQRLIYEKERSEANETRLLRIIDQNRTDHAAERHTLSAALDAARQRELHVQQQWEVVQQEHTLIRSTLAGVEERNRLLEAELVQIRSVQQEQETRYLESLREQESLRSELRIHQRERKLLQEEIEVYRQALLLRDTSNPFIRIEK